MSLRSHIAEAASSFTTFAIRHLAHRPGGSLPGKIGLSIDPNIIAESRSKLEEGCIVVVGTNGKTTTTNLLANVIEQSGKTVLCNRGGDNLKNGIATALLQGKKSNWGVIECDELWLEKILPSLQANWVILLNLFRDQLDRCGEIERIQDSIVNALIATPSAGLIYNADDPLCAYIAKRVSELRSGDSPQLISFGLTESMGLAQNKVADASLCQVCSHIFDYEFRQYGQLGYYKCPHCGFHRPHLQYLAKNVELSVGSLAFDACDEINDSCNLIKTNFSGTYNVYNLLAIFACTKTIGCSVDAMQKAIDCFNPQNGRLQWYEIGERKVLLNLAKNPTGFNQNLRIIAGEKSVFAVAFFINDQVVDGHDISWIWDIDFEEIIAMKNAAFVFAGGTRKNDLQVRLKYAGVKATLVDDIAEVLSDLADFTQNKQLPSDAPLYVIANYSALPPVRESLNKLGRAVK